MTTAGYDGAAILSDLSGVSRDEILSMWEQVKENAAKLKVCSRHRFEARPVKIGQKFRCLNCGGEMDLTRIGRYVEGYKAAGGNPDDVWPGWFSR